MIGNNLRKLLLNIFGRFRLTTDTSEGCLGFTVVTAFDKVTRRFWEKKKTDN